MEHRKKLDDIQITNNYSHFENFSRDNDNNSLKEKERKTIIINCQKLTMLATVTLHTKRSASIVQKRFEASPDPKQNSNKEKRGEKEKARCVSAGVQNPLCVSVLLV